MDEEGRVLPRRPVGVHGCRRADRTSEHRDRLGALPRLIHPRQSERRVCSAWHGSGRDEGKAGTRGPAQRDPAAFGL